jgi:1-acyl-sn-glycerol-3-phosphate acyltransferase
LKLRWRYTRGSIRLILRLAGIKLTTAGLDRLPEGEPVVLVANHASYLDGPMIIAAFRDPLVIVAKAELGEHFISRVLMRRLDVNLVERLDRIQGVEDARDTVDILKKGRSLVYFPEGTLTRSPGLLPFHLGAFVAAAETGATVYPLLIKGTRSVLRGEEWYPRRAPVHIELGEPLCADGTGWNAAVALRDASRAQMLAELGEPDVVAL